MRTKGRRAAIAGGVVAAGMLLVAGWLFREDLQWWWRMRGVDRFGVWDQFLGEHVLEDPAAVAHAQEVTQGFLRSLSRQKPSGSKIVGHFSQVIFVRAGHGVVKVWLNQLLDYENWVVDCEGVRYSCTLSGWFGYLRDVIGPITPALVARWQGQMRQRFKTAAALALVAPETPGLVEYLCVAALEGKENRTALLLLGEMGQLAASAVPLIEALAADPAVQKDVRDGATRALKRIRGDVAPDSPPTGE